MRVRGILNLKNDVVREWRTSRGLTQLQAADLAGVGVSNWGSLECLRFDLVPVFALEQMASLMGVDVEVIAPAALAGKRVTNRVEMVADMEDSRLAAGQLTLPELPAPDEAAMVEEAKAALREAMTHLTWREREVLKARHGLDDTEALTLGEVAKVFKCSRERVRQIEAKAIHRLRKKPCARIIEAAWAPLVSEDDG